MKALLTDLYELNMVASYLRRDMNGQATFSLFVRRLPETRGFLVAAGIESCIEYLEQLSFDGDDLQYLGDVLKFRPEDLEAFVGDPDWTPQRRFDRLFERLRLPGLARMARYDLLVTLGRIGVLDLEKLLYQLRAAGHQRVLLARKTCCTHGI